MPAICYQHPECSNSVSIESTTLVAYRRAEEVLLDKPQPSKEIEGKVVVELCIYLLLSTLHYSTQANMLYQHRSTLGTFFTDTSRREQTKKMHERWTGCYTMFLLFEASFLRFTATALSRIQILKPSVRRKVTTHRFLQKARIRAAYPSNTLSFPTQTWTLETTTHIAPDKYLTTGHGRELDASVHPNHPQHRSCLQTTKQNLQITPVPRRASLT